MDTLDPSKKARRYRWTWNNYTTPDVERLMDPPKLHNSIDYLTFGWEVAPSTGTPHLQGYVEFNGPVNYSVACTRLDPTRGGRGKGKTPHQVRVLPADADRSANVRYVRKSETKDPFFTGPDGEPRIFEWLKEGAERTRGLGTSERKEAWAAKLDYLRQNPQLEAFAQENPEEAFKHAHAIKALSSAMQEASTRETVASRYPKNMRMRVWQRALVSMLEGATADDRTVFWFYDEAGAAGKSLLTKWLGIHMDACYLSNGRTSDIAFAYKGQRIVVFDFSRTMEERINYTALEMLKNGTAFSPKYESQGKMVLPPWVVVFSNSKPQVWTMTMDRWIVLDMSSDPGIMEMEPNEEGLLVEVTFPSNKGYALNDPVLARMMAKGGCHIADTN